MSLTLYETLDDTGFNFTQVGMLARRKTANFGDGYTAGARFGDARGLRAWQITIDVLPDFYLQCDLTTYQDTRSRYLWNFWRRHKLENDTEIFIMRDPFPEDASRQLNRVFARFKDEEINYTMDTDFLFSTGLTIIEARVSGYTDANEYTEPLI